MSNRCPQHIVESRVHKPLVGSACSAVTYVALQYRVSDSFDDCIVEERALAEELKEGGTAVKGVPFKCTDISNCDVGR
jgi:hypothetical protein